MRSAAGTIKQSAMEIDIFLRYVICTSAFSGVGRGPVPWRMGVILGNTQRYQGSSKNSSSPEDDPFEYSGISEPVKVHTSAVNTAGDDALGTPSTNQPLGKVLEYGRYRDNII